MLYAPKGIPNYENYCNISQDHELEKALDKKILKGLDIHSLKDKKTKLNFEINNVNRTVGAIISGNLTKIYGEKGIPQDNLEIEFTGSAGQSFGAFLSKGIYFNVIGDSNDYFAKGISGGKISISPNRLDKNFIPENHVIIGNVALYGATGGEVYINGKAGERFCVRNSAANAVVEGIGNHGCEYMTGGIVVILGEVGSNFAAGMSGGIAYVYDKNFTFINNFNSELSNMSEISINSKDENDLKNLIKNHVKYTNSEKGKKILLNWREELKKFKKVIPRDYEKVLDKLNHQRKRVKVNG